MRGPSASFRSRPGPSGSARRPRRRGRGAARGSPSRGSRGRAEGAGGAPGCPSVHPGRVNTIDRCSSAAHADLKLASGLCGSG